MISSSPPMTQGENIADLGGIVMGYDAFKKTNQYKNNEIVAGLTPDQRFFLAYAMAWMINDRPEAISNQVLSDVHSPAKYRVLGPLSNMGSKIDYLYECEVALCRLQLSKSV